MLEQIVYDDSRSLINPVKPKKVEAMKGKNSKKKFSKLSAMARKK